MTLVTRLLPVPKSWQEFCPNAIGNAPCVAGVVRGMGAVIEPARRSQCGPTTRYRRICVPDDEFGSALP
jgi:hypothetical protein